MSNQQLRDEAGHPKDQHGNGWEWFDRNQIPIELGARVRDGNLVGTVSDLAETDLGQYARVLVYFAPEDHEPYSCTAKWPEDYRAWDLEVVQ